MQSNFAAVGRSFGLSKELVARIVRGTISHVWAGTAPEIQRQFPLFLLPLTTYKGVLHPVQPEHRELVVLSDVEKRIIELRAQRVKGEKIRSQLDLTEGQYNYRVSKLLHTGKITENPRAGRSVGGNDRVALEQVFDRCLAQDPNQAVSLSWLGRQAGINRERARQLYPQIAAERKAPPLISRKLPKDLAKFDQRVDELGTQGLSSAEISEKLYVAKTLVEQAQRRVTEKKQEADKNSVRELREQGYGTKIIVEMTGLTRGKVGHILEELFPKGEARRLRKRRKTKEEIEQLKEKVVQLRLDPRNLTAKQIAEITGEEEYSIVTYTNKLIAERRIPKRG